MQTAIDLLIEELAEVTMEYEEGTEAGTLSKEEEEMTVQIMADLSKAIKVLEKAQ